MTTPTISLLHATWHRPEKAVATMAQWLGAAAVPADIEYIVAANEDDEKTIAAFAGSDHAKVVTGPYRGSAPAWNDAARASAGDWLVQVSDDFVAPDRWDDFLLATILSNTPSNWRDFPTVVAVSDGHRTDSLMTMAICNRAYYRLEGYFLFPAYTSVFSDGHFTFRALRRAKAGTARLVNASHLVFDHRHAYHDKTVEMDETYKKQNSPEAYEQGARIFDAIHPDWRETGLVDWHK